MATMVARRPTTRPLASISTHFFVTSAGLAEKVFMTDFRGGGDRRARRRTARRCRESAGAGQCHVAHNAAAITKGYNYGIGTPPKISRIWNGIGRGDMGDWIGG